MPGSGLLFSSLLPRYFDATLHLMPYYTVPLIVATLASVATAALFHSQLKHYRRLTKSLLSREANHLDTIFSLQQQLKDARALHPNS